MQSDKPVAATPTIGAVMQETKMSGGKSIAIGLAMVMLGIGLIYTGVHNYNLFVRALPDDQKVFAFIPVILLEGSIVLFMLGGFVWFAPGTQKILATVFGWLLFAIVMANTVVDSMTQKQDVMPEWLLLYALVLLPGVPVVVIAMWKMIIDLDPAKRKLDMKKAIEHAVDEAQFRAAQASLSEANIAEALGIYGKNFSDAIAALVVGSSPPIIKGGTTMDKSISALPPAPAPAPAPEPTDPKGKAG